MQCWKVGGGLFVRTIAVATFLLLYSCSGCTSGSANPAGPPDYPLRVLCTTGMIAEAVAAVGGRHVVVEQLMPPGVDPHLYRPTARDKWRINAAQVVFYNGLHLEGRLEPLLVKRARFLPVYAVTEDLGAHMPECLRPLAEGGSLYDPHVWLDPVLWAECVKYIARRLAQLDPERATDYRAQAEQYLIAVSELDRYARQQLGAIPPARRVLVTTHDAFGYFGRRYGLTVKSLQGLSTLDEIDLRSMNALIRELVAEQIPAVFVESSVSPKALQAVVAGCQALGHRLRIGGELYADCLGPPGSAGETFLGAFRWNVDTIVAALR